MAYESIELLSADPHAKKMLSDYHKAAVSLHASYAQYIAGRDIVLLTTLINTTDAVNPFMRPERSQAKNRGICGCIGRCQVRCKNESEDQPKGI